MKPLKLYTRFTILVSAVLIAVLLGVVYFFISKAKEIEQQDQVTRAQLWATQLANTLVNDPLEKSVQQRDVIFFRKAHEGQIQQIRVYGVIPKRNVLEEFIAEPAGEPEEISARDQL